MYVAAILKICIEFLNFRNITMRLFVAIEIIADLILKVVSIIKSSVL